MFYALPSKQLHAIFLPTFIYYIFKYKNIDLFEVIYLNITMYDKIYIQNDTILINFFPTLL